MKKQIILYILLMFMSFVNAQTIPKSIDHPEKTKPKKERVPKIVVKQIPIYIEKNKDSDGDGLTDEIDECPSVKGTPKNGGCPELVEPKTSEVKNEPETILKEEEVMSANEVEVLPEFTMGQAGLTNHIIDNLNYPTSAVNTNISGTVFISFVVDYKGNVKDITVLRGLGREFDEEAIRVVRLMPRWTPGYKNGKPVNVQLYIPIGFASND